MPSELLAEDQEWVRAAEVIEQIRVAERLKLDGEIKGYLLTLRPGERLVAEASLWRFFFHLFPEELTDA